MSNLFALQALAQRPEDSDRDRGRDRGGDERSRGGDERSRGGEDRGRGGPPGGGPDGMTSDRIFGYMDRNKNGILDPEETERMPSHVKENLAKSGFDLKKGLDTKQFGKAFEEMRKVREADDSRRREEYEKKKREESGSTEEKKTEPAPVRKVSITVKPHERVTKDIPKTFEEGDADQDGQVAFHEWRQWKRAETDNFFTYDHNGDGFLTPAELIKGPATDKVAALETLKSGTSITVSPVASSSVKPASGSGIPVKTVSASSSSSTIDMDSAEAKRARSTFRLLDKDRSGNVTPDEWASSSKLRPQFTDAGVDISKSMDEATFIGHYVKISG